MKKYLIILVCLMTGGYTASAKIWRVNNNPGVPCDYTDLKAAVDAASTLAGDTIHLEGSITAYITPVTVTKKLFIFGPGYDLNVNAETQHIKQSAKVANISFEAGSNGSVLAGVEHNAHTQTTINTGTVSIIVAIAGWTGPRITVNENNITILNCRLFWVDIKNDKPLTDITIKKSWFGPGLIRTTSTSAVLNLSIVNNYFRNDASQSQFTTIDLGPSAKSLINNNTFYYLFKIVATNGSTITNNVFWGINGNMSLSADNSNAYQRNIYNRLANFGGMVNAVNGNVFNNEGDPLKWFSGAGTSLLADRYYTAKSGSPSPIRDAADPSTKELGMYGGLSPYELSGLTTIPAVYEIVMPTEVSSGGFDVTVKVKAH